MLKEIKSHLNNAKLEKKMNQLEKSIPEKENYLNSINEEIKQKQEERNYLENLIEGYRKNVSEYNKDWNKNREKINEINSMRAEKKKLEQELMKLNNEIKNNKKQKNEMEDVLKELDKEIQGKKTEKVLLTEEIEDLEYKKNILEQQLSKFDFDSLDYVDKIDDGFKFEEYIASMLKKLDYEDVEITSKTGDYGIDVLACKDEVKWGFQCKLYSNSVGIDAVQQAFAGKTHYNCAIAAVVTNNYFTKEAQTIAQENNVQLWDRDKLAQKLNEAKNAKINIF